VKILVEIPFEIPLEILFGWHVGVVSAFDCVKVAYASSQRRSGMFMGACVEIKGSCAGAFHEPLPAPSCPHASGRASLLPEERRDRQRSQERNATCAC